MRAELHRREGEHRVTVVISCPYPPEETVVVGGRQYRLRSERSYIAHYDLVERAPCPKCGRMSRLAAVGGDCLSCSMQPPSRDTQIGERSEREGATWESCTDFGDDMPNEDELGEAMLRAARINAPALASFGIAGGRGGSSAQARLEDAKSRRIAELEARVAELEDTPRHAAIQLVTTRIAELEALCDGQVVTLVTKTKRIAELKADLAEARHWIEEYRALAGKFEADLAAARQAAFAEGLRVARLEQALSEAHDDLAGAGHLARDSRYLIRARIGKALSELAEGDPEQGGAAGAPIKAQFTSGTLQDWPTGERP